MSNNALIILIKNPVLGTVKTRLAKDIGANAALQIYQKLLTHTRTISQQINAHRFLFYKDVIADDAWSSADFDKQLQPEGHLGDKMKFAFEDVFKIGFEKTLIIGSDCPGISKDIIDDAFHQLDTYDVVLGPANDGGYYLLGMTQFLPELFDISEWSTESVLEETCFIVESMQLSYGMLPELIDIDTLDDLNQSGI